MTEEASLVLVLMYFERKAYHRQQACRDPITTRPENKLLVALMIR